MIGIINDSRDANARARQEIRVQHLFRAPTSFLEVTNDIEASGNVIDMLDATRGSSSVVLGNVAPRNGEAKQWENGTPFGYFRYHNTLVVTTVDGYTLSLVKKLNLTSEINVINYIPALQTLKTEGYISEEERLHMETTQFRSFHFLPVVAKAIWDMRSIPHESWSIARFPDLSSVIWWIDSFGNAKTNLLSEEISNHRTLSTTQGPFPIYHRLKDVPTGQDACVTGSSGLESHRFLELVGQGFSLAKEYDLTTGTKL